MSENCLICQSPVSKPKTWVLPQGDIPCDNYLCPRCGDYNIPFTLSQELPYLLNKDQRKIAVLSHWVRSKYENNLQNKKHRELIVLYRDLVESIIKNPPPTTAEQADKFVLWLGGKIPSAGEMVKLRLECDLSIMGAETPKGFDLIVKHLADDGILKPIDPLRIDGIDITLSFKGWQYYEKLKRGSTDSRKAFMAMDYSNKTLETIVNEFFRDAVKSTGFVLFRLDDVSKAGPIDDRLRVEIQTSRFLIADLTDDNPGAYWEAGYAEGLGKPVIYTCEKNKFEKDSTHFDTNHHLTIKWEETNPKEAAEKLKDTIRATLPEAAKLTDD